VARHGLAKLGMGDVSEASGLSRATIYRYFRSLEEILARVAQREGDRFQERVWQAVAEAPAPDRIHIALHLATREARDNPILRRVLDTDPAFVLRSLRERLPVIKKMIREPFAPLLDQTAPVRKGVATVDQLVDWLTRLMISAYLFPDPEPERMGHDLTAVYRVLTQRESPRETRPAGRLRGEQRHVGKERRERRTGS
jgi:AcrR family transcriptional regulator